MTASLLARRLPALALAAMVTGCMAPHVQPLPLSRTDGIRLSASTPAGLPCLLVPATDADVREVYCGRSVLPVLVATRNVPRQAPPAISPVQGMKDDTWGDYHVRFVAGLDSIITETRQKLSGNVGKPGPGEPGTGQQAVSDTYPPREFRAMGHLLAGRDDYAEARDLFEAALVRLVTPEQPASKDKPKEAAWFDGGAKVCTFPESWRAEVKQDADYLKLAEMSAALGLAHSNLYLTGIDHSCAKPFLEVDCDKERDLPGVLLGYAAMLKANEGLFEAAKSCAAAARKNLREELDQVLAITKPVPKTRLDRFGRRRDILEMDFAADILGDGLARQGVGAPTLGLPAEPLLAKVGSIRSQIWLLEDLSGELESRQANAGACVLKPDTREQEFSSGMAYRRRTAGLCSLRATPSPDMGAAASKLDHASKTMRWLSMRGRVHVSTDAATAAAMINGTGDWSEVVPRFARRLAEARASLTVDAQELLLSELFRVCGKPDGCPSDPSFQALVYAVMGAGRPAAIELTALRLEHFRRLSEDKATDDKDKCIQLSVLRAVWELGIGGLYDDASPSDRAGAGQSPNRSTEDIKSLREEINALEAECGVAQVSPAADLKAARTALSTEPREAILAFVAGRNAAFGLHVTKEGFQFWQLDDSPKELEKSISGLWDEINQGGLVTQSWKPSYASRLRVREETLRILTEKVTRQLFCKGSKCVDLGIAGAKPNNGIGGAKTYDRWIVVSGYPFDRLPLGVLFTPGSTAPTTQGFKNWPWLGMDVAMVYAPGLAVAPGSALPSTAARPGEVGPINYRGFIVTRPDGNIEIFGGQKNEYDNAHWALANKENKRCPDCRESMSEDEKKSCDSCRIFIKHLEQSVRSFTAIRYWSRMGSDKDNNSDYRRAIKEIPGAANGKAMKVDFYAPLRSQIPMMLSKAGPDTILEFAAHSLESSDQSGSRATTSARIGLLPEMDKESKPKGKELELRLADLSMSDVDLFTAAIRSGSKSTPLNDAVVVLSSCSSNRAAGADGLYGRVYSGPANAFMANGASSVVVSAWPIPIEWTGRVTIAFLEDLSMSKQPAGEAGSVVDLANSARMALRRQAGVDVGGMREPPASAYPDPMLWGFMAVLGRGWMGASAPN